jgi:hypothetical protein
MPLSRTTGYFSSLGIVTSSLNIVLLRTFVEFHATFIFLTLYGHEQRV